MLAHQRRSSRLSESFRASASRSHGAASAKPVSATPSGTSFSASKLSHLANAQGDKHALLRLVATFFHGQPRFALLVAIEKPFLHASTHAPTLPFAGIVLNRQGIPAAGVRLSTDRPLPHSTGCAAVPTI
jgi:hypothetical protein